MSQPFITQEEIARSVQTATLRLNWNPVPETLPPGAETHWFSPTVWLALSDGRVAPGQCLHRVKGATYNAPVHSWFIEDGGRSVMLSDGITVIAWMPFAVPDHPSADVQGATPLRVNESGRLEFVAEPASRYAGAGEDDGAPE